ncbi:MAG: anaerobic sulfatase maturase [Bacillota bacterium]
MDSGSTPSNIPRAFHIMAKPTGSACNLNCAYCFFLKKKGLYPESNFRMSDEVLEAYIRQLLEAHQVPQVTVAWQGGEPTLMGLDFFRRALELQEKYRRPGTVIENTFQTNGVLLDDKWCQFFQENGFLVGLSIDGPKELHNFYRKDKGGQGTWERAVRAARLLQKHNVAFNILCAVNSKNADHPLQVYRFFRDELDAQYLQFIPIVERKNESGFQEGVEVTDRSVSPGQWGQFLIEIFDEWVRRDVGKTFVLNFDGILAGWLGMAGTLCIFGATCGLGMALEHNGDLYSCDHFVEPDYYLGNIMQTPLAELAGSGKQHRFGQDKRDNLPRSCLQCQYLFACNGECPKNRFLTTPEGEPGLNYLCAGYKRFFEHADTPLKLLAELLRRGRPAAQVMSLLTRAGDQSRPDSGKISRNASCPCGSGLKYKKCHGLNRVPSTPSN